MKAKAIETGDPTSLVNANVKLSYQVMTFKLDTMAEVAALTEPAAFLHFTGSTLTTCNQDPPWARQAAVHYRSWDTCVVMVYNWYSSQPTTHNSHFPLEGLTKALRLRCPAFHWMAFPLPFPPTLPHLTLLHLTLPLPPYPFLPLYLASVGWLNCTTTRSTLHPSSEAAGISITTTVDCRTSCE